MDTDSSDDTSSDYSTDSSDDDGMETAEIAGTVLQLPQGLCERKDIFQAVLSIDTWNSLSDSNRQHLQNFLPHFPHNDEEEKKTTLEKLLNCETFRFGSPLEKFHQDLKAGYFRPDIANMRKIIKKAERKEAMFRYRKFREKLKQDVVESQKILINQISSLPPGVEPRRIEKHHHDPNLNYIVHRTKRRYYQILASIQAKTEDNYCSPDENYPEGPPVPLSRKQRRHLNSIKNTACGGGGGGGGELFISTMSPKNSNNNGLDLEKYITPLRNPFYITDETYKNLLIQHKRRRVERRRCKEPEYNTKGITLTDIVNRTQLPYMKNFNSAGPGKHHHHHHHLDNKLVNNNNNNRKKAKKEVRLNQQSPPPNIIGNSSNSELDSDSDSYIDAVSVNHKKVSSSKQLKNDIVPPPPPPPLLLPKPETSTVTTTSVKTTPLPSMQYGKITPVTISDLEGIDMMEIPIDLDNTNIDILEFNTNNKPAPELMQETHSNFLSLIRDIICSTNEHRMSLQTLEERLRSWQKNPISPLNDWYSLTDNWVSFLKSAVNFLCGNFSEQPEDFVPYMEYKMSLDMYQWIGAGRDSDTLLAPLCQYWLEHRKTETKSILVVTKEQDKKEETTTTTTATMMTTTTMADRSQTPPPPRCPTNWTVRKATPDEIKQFRDQERKRYDNPHKAFTYRCNGYESVVGPLKGIYNPSVVGNNAKARGHTMLNADRPNFVTILSLVRDATARLPNGEGTRADICELLKSSQYISNTAPDNILQSVVSGALDRMHTQFDPCVKYDPKRKIWIYLHRNRSEEDFERIHQQYQGVNNKTTKKSTTSTKKTCSSSSSKGKLKMTDKVVKNEEKMKMVTTNKSENNKSNSLLLSNQEILLKQQQTPDDEKEINEALQAIVMQNRVGVSSAAAASSPTTSNIIKHCCSSSSSPKQPKGGGGGGGLVKILSPMMQQGKSLIISSQEPRVTPPPPPPPPKQINQSSHGVTTQQLLQTLQAKQKQQQSANQNEKKLIEVKTSQQQQQQFIQSITPQQLQNIKNVTVVRGVNQTITEHSTTKIAAAGAEQQIQIKTQATLTPAQHQILQTIKQKILPQATMQQQQQQILLKQKAMQQQQKQQILGQTTKLTTMGGLATAQSPVVAKVLTNAAGQVISVESLLAHQKQHGSLPQGTTLRVSGTKGSPANIIQLTGTSKQNHPIAQFAVASQNNILITSSQPKLVVASTTPTTTIATTNSSSSTTITATTTVGKSIARTMVNKQVVTAAAAATKFPAKIAQQLINAKLISTDGQKVVLPKIFMGQQNQVKLAQAKNITSSSSSSSLTKPVTLATNANTIRMVNAANLNLTHIGGKPVLLASKGQNVLLQPQPNNTSGGGGGGGGGVVLQSGAVVKTTATNLIQSQQQQQHQQNVTVLGAAPQLKVQTPQTPAQQVVFSSGGVGHPVRLQGSTATNAAQRVVLASQGQGGQILAQQILLPAGFQGTAINIKALQGVKVIPLAQAHNNQGRGVQGRQVFARVMSPAVIKGATSTTEKGSADPTITSSD